MAKDNTCEACGAVEGVDAHRDGCPATKVTITDKRGKKKDMDAFNEGASEGRAPLPTAQELLDMDGQEDGEDSKTEFEKQRLEEERRVAAWEAMTDEEKQAVLAKQAAESEQIPYGGGGVQNEGEMKKSVMTAFIVVVDLNGSALATDNLDILDSLDIERSATPDDMYRSLAEIQKDILAQATAMHTVMLMSQQAQQMQSQARAQQLAGQVQQRGFGRR